MALVRTLAGAFVTLLEATAAATATAPAPLARPLAVLFSSGLLLT
jgi:hypothetical protein